MIYKMIEDDKWEYRTQIVTVHDITYDQVDSKLDGVDGWEAFSVEHMYDDKFVVFLKRKYKEVLSINHYQGTSLSFQWRMKE